MDSARLAEELRRLGYYVSRHANWLLVLKGNEIVATIYVYPDYKEVTVVDRDEITELVRKTLKEYKVTKREPRLLI